MPIQEHSRAFALPMPAILSFVIDRRNINVDTYLDAPMLLRCERVSDGGGWYLVRRLSLALHSGVWMNYSNVVVYIKSSLSIARGWYR